MNRITLIEAITEPAIFETNHPFVKYLAREQHWPVLENAFDDYATALTELRQRKLGFGTYIDKKAAPKLAQTLTSRVHTRIPEVQGVPIQIDIAAYNRRDLNIGGVGAAALLLGFQSAAPLLFPGFDPTPFTVATVFTSALAAPFLLEQIRPNQVSANVFKMQKMRKAFFAAEFCHLYSAFLQGRMGRKYDNSESSAMISGSSRHIAEEVTFEMANEESNLAYAMPSCQIKTEHLWAAYVMVADLHGRPVSPQLDQLARKTVRPYKKLRRFTQNIRSHTGPMGDAVLAVAERLHEPEIYRDIQKGDRSFLAFDRSAHEVHTRLKLHARQITARFRLIR